MKAEQAQSPPEEPVSDAMWRGILALSFVVAAGLVLASALPSGPAITADSVTYIDVARHLEAGNGPLARNAHGDPVLVTTWPPLYATLISLGMVLGMDAQISAVLFNSIALGVMAVLCGLLASLVGRSRKAGIIAALLAATAPAFILNAAHVWSETVFLAFEVGAALALVRFARTDRRRYLLAGGLLVGLACMQRYAGYAFIAAGIAWLSQLRPGTWRTRLSSCAWFALAAVPLPFAWRLVTMLVSHEIDARGFEFVMPAIDQFRLAASAISIWFLPLALPKVLRGLGLLVLGGLVLGGLALLIRRRLQTEARPQFERPGTLIALFALSYAATAFSTIVFMDPLLRPDERLLSPLLPLVIVALAWAISSLKGKFELAGLAFATLLAASFAVRDVRVAQRVHEGIDFSHPSWKESSLLDHASRLPEDEPLYSNYTQPLVLYFDRKVQAVPRETAYELTKPLGIPAYDDLPSAQARARDELHDGGYVVWFKYGHGEQELTGVMQALDLEIVESYPNGWLLASRAVRK